MEVDCCNLMGAETDGEASVGLARTDGGASPVKASGTFHNLLRKEM